MPEFEGFVGPSYQSESLSVNAQRCVNLFLEQDPLGKMPTALYGTPGLRLLANVGTGPVRAIEAFGDSLLVLSGGELWRVHPDFSATMVLPIGTTSGPAFIAQAGVNALVVDGNAGYAVGITGNDWNAALITSDGFPLYPATCTAMDGYFITHSAGMSQSFQISSPFDASTWDAADVAAKEGQSDRLVRVIATYRLLYLIGERTSEVWQDLGDATGDTFPFIRIQGAFIEQGTIAAASVRDIDGAVFWLGNSKAGANIIWRMQGFSPVRISTHAQEVAISKYVRVDDAFAWTYQDGGHAFYVLSFPTAGVTWAFDITTQLWHERPYRNPTTAQEEAHRGMSHAFFNGQHIIGDRATGKLYALDRECYDDAGDPLVASRTTPHVFNDGARGFMSELEVFFEPGTGLANGQGSDPQAMLRISKDGGRSFGYERSTSIGLIGQYRRRARWQRLVNARDIVIQVSISDPVKRVINGAALRIS